MVVRFGEFELDDARFELRRSGAPVHVEPLVFDLIRCLVSSAGTVLSKDEIVNKVWDGRFVSDATVSGAIKSARKALGDSGSTQAMIETVRGRGFRFLPDVEGGAEAPSAPSTAQALPALAVLPFQALGDDTEAKGVADGLTENLTTVLTRVPLLSVASRMSAFSLGKTPVSPADVRDALSVDMMVEGSVQVLGDRLRVNVQLILTRTGHHAWAQVFEEPRGPDGLPSLVEAILNQLEPQIMRAMPDLLASAEGKLGPRQRVLQAIILLSLKGWHSDSFTEAIGILRQAAQDEPDFALAHAWLALIHSLGQRVGLVRTGPEDVANAIAAADRALELDPMDSHVLGLAGCALADVKQTARAVPILRRAVSIGPNNAQARTALGSALMLDGEVPEAIGHLEAGIRISPADNRRAIWGAVLSMAYLMAEKPAEARRAAEIACEADMRSYLPLLALTAANMVLEDHRSTERSAAECARLKPDISEVEVTCIVGRDLGPPVHHHIRAALT